MTERNATLDQMIEFAMEELLSGDAQRKRAMVRRMAERWSAEPALALVYAVTCATEAIEDAFGDAADRDPVIPLKRFAFILTHSRPLGSSSRTRWG